MSSKNAFSPKNIEQKWYQFWEKQNLFHSKPNPSQKPYTIVIPPPNVTGALHMGHALNNTLQDVLIRFHRMQGYNACWIPGTDHAGIATQSVVEKKLYDEEGKTRHDIGRDALVKKIWDWKEKYGNRIIEQLKRLGCSCDWKRTHFTMSPSYSTAVQEVFLKLFKKKLIYRGKRLINWCPGCRTALSNDELVYKEIPAHLWTIQYPIEGKKNQYIPVATTRPETMLGDTAVAVHPKDKRYKKWIGKSCILPLLQRKIPIIADPILANPEKGTGAVKVTPAHDPNDYACGIRNQLPLINILNEDGTLNSNAGPYANLTIPQARKLVLQDLKKQNLLTHTQPILHSVAHCYRSHDIVEPYLSSQWFVKMQPLVQKALQAAKKKQIQFFPPKREQDYLRWLHQTPDWCISRQIWWGHRIPIWYCTKCHPEIQLDNNHEPLKIPENATPILPPSPQKKPNTCPQCHSKQLVQDPDVLDTWFSSQLWPLATLGWPKITKDLQYYYPTNVLVTGRDIIALWVARMVMMGLEFVGKKPFKTVLIHGTIQDEHGNIMSKSRGNGFDPVKVIEGGSDQIHGKQKLGNIPAKRTEHYPCYGADALRYGVLSMTSGEGQDIRLPIHRKKRPDQSYDVSIPKFEEGRRLCNKIYQACHGLIFPHCQQFKFLNQPSPYLEDRWLSTQLYNGISTITQYLQNYQIGEACYHLYHLFWDDFCSWYLELIKPRLKNNTNQQSQTFAKIYMTKAIYAFLRLFHPIMPFISEELYQTLLPKLKKAGLKNLPKACIIAPWPKKTEFRKYPKSLQINKIAQNILSAIQNIRAEQNLKPSQTIPLTSLLHVPKPWKKELLQLLPSLQPLAKVQTWNINPPNPPTTDVATRMVENIQVLIPLKGLINKEAEKKKLQKELEKQKNFVHHLETKLANINYLQKAPQHIVQKDKERLQKELSKLQQLQQQWEKLQSP